MSEKTRRKRKPAIKTSLPKPKAEPTKEKELIICPDFDMTKTQSTEGVIETTIPSPTPAQDVLLAILKKAPVLPWKIDKTYINNVFRKEYVELLRNLVNMLALPYTVDQAGMLTPK